MIDSLLLYPNAGKRARASVTDLDTVASVTAGHTAVTGGDEEVDADLEVEGDGHIFFAVVFDDAREDFRISVHCKKHLAFERVTKCRNRRWFRGTPLLWKHFCVCPGKEQGNLPMLKTTTVE